MRIRHRMSSLCLGDTNGPPVYSDMLVGYLSVFVMCADALG